MERSLVFARITSRCASPSMNSFADELAIPRRKKNKWLLRITATKWPHLNGEDTSSTRLSKVPQIWALRFPAQEVSICAQLLLGIAQHQYANSTSGPHNGQLHTYQPDPTIKSQENNNPQSTWHPQVLFLDSCCPMYSICHDRASIFPAGELFPGDSQLHLGSFFYGCIPMVFPGILAIPSISWYPKCIEKNVVFFPRYHRTCFNFSWSLHDFTVSPCFFRFSQLFSPCFPNFPRVSLSSVSPCGSQAALRAWCPRTTPRRQIQRPPWPQWPGTADISAPAWQVRDRCDRCDSWFIMVYGNVNGCFLLVMVSIMVNNG